jgi:hypothetical protein
MLQIDIITVVRVVRFIIMSFLVGVKFFLIDIDILNFYKLSVSYYLVRTVIDEGSTDAVFSLEEF